MAFDVYQHVTDKIVAAMDQAIAWEKPWSNAFGDSDGRLVRPVNAITKRRNVPRLDHAAYIKGWLKVLKNDKRAIFTAASKAEQACTYLAGLQQPAAAIAA